MSAIRFVGRARAELVGLVTESELGALAENAHLKVLQCPAPVPAPVWDLLNTSFFSRRPDVELRIYAHYGLPCDLAFARTMTNVHRFAADCLMNATNVDAIGEIPHLESLAIGIFELRDFQVLERVSPYLTRLALAATRSRAPSLALLERFRSLKTLYLEGQSKAIDVVRELTTLEDITLRSITTADVSYLAPLPRLWSVDIKLGGIRSFAGLEDKGSVKYLELWQIRGLHDVGIISALPGLQHLFLQSLPHIAAIPSLATNTALRRVVLQNLKGLQDFHAFEHAPALEEFCLIEGKAQSPEQLLPVLRNPSVRQVRASFGSHRKNQSFVRMRDEHGKVEGPIPWQPFEFRREDR